MTFVSTEPANMSSGLILVIDDIQHTFAAFRSSFPIPLRMLYLLQIRRQRAVLLDLGHIQRPTNTSPKVDTSLATTLEAICKSLCICQRSLLEQKCSPVYEYPLNGQWIMLDMDDGYVLWTGIWKGKHAIENLLEGVAEALFSAWKFER